MKLTSLKPQNRVAWLGHAINAAHLKIIDPSLASMSDEALEKHLDEAGIAASPQLKSRVEIQSVTGETTQLCAILLPVTSQWMKSRIETRRRRECQALVQKGIDLARDHDCGLVSLGQYSSIATRNGRRVEAHGMGVTTGNSYTAALAVQAIDRALRERDQPAEGSTIVIVGAAGNIGRVCVDILAPQFHRAILVGSGKTDSQRRLQEVATGFSHVDVADQPDAIRQGDVVVVATSSVKFRLGAEYFKRHAIVCDLSVPANVDRNLGKQRCDLEILAGGIVRIPFGEELHIDGFPLPAGHTFACMAEGMLLSYEAARDDEFTGLL